MTNARLNRPAATRGAERGLSTIGDRVAIAVGRESGTSVLRTPAHKVLLGGGGRLQHGRASQQIDDPVALPAGVAHQVFVRPQATGVIVHLDARRYRFEDAERLARRWHSFVPGLDDPLDLYEDAFRVSAPRLDARLETAIDLLETGSPVSDIARDVRLSESRLTHLFSGRLGTPPRTWRSWLLLRKAVLGIATGSTFTQAAYGAGFADASHLSRTCRDAFGVTPTLLAAYHTRFVTERLGLIDCDRLRAAHQVPRLVEDAIRTAYAADLPVGRGRADTRDRPGKR